MFRNLFISVGLVGLLAGCATISEESCLAGNWESLGYDEASAGGSRDNFGSIVKDCAKHNVTADRISYMRGYDQGLAQYCVYDRGYDRGAAGGTPLAECVRAGFTDYADGVEAGRYEYELRQAHSSMVKDYRQIRENIEDLERRIAEDDTLTDTDITALRRDIRTMDGQLVDLRIDIRAFEAQHGWPKVELD
jgi:hypothetical protein